MPRRSEVSGDYNLGRFRSKLNKGRRAVVSLPLREAHTPLCHLCLNKRAPPEGLYCTTCKAHLKHSLTLSGSFAENHIYSLFKGAIGNFSLPKVNELELLYSCTMIWDRASVRQLKPKFTDYKHRQRVSQRVSEPFSMIVRNIKWPFNNIVLQKSYLLYL